MEDSSERVARAVGPWTMWREWYDEALATPNPWAHNMVLSTCGADGQPQSRHAYTSLPHDLQAEGFVFCSNYDGPKARQLEENPKAAVLFRWPETMRQVRITGVVHKVTKCETETLFRLCSRVEQICFYALSHGQDHPFNQSNDEPSHQERAEYLQGMMDRYMLSPQDVPLPSAWGGFRLVPDTIEFLDTRVGWTQRTLYHRTLGAATTPSGSDQGAAATDVPVGEWQRKYLVP